MTETTHLALPFIDAAQAQKHVTHNEALQLLDALVHLSVSARNQGAPPLSPTEGQRFLVGAGATGAFAGKDFQIASFIAGAWTFLVPRAGWRVYVEGESLLFVYDGAVWKDAGLTLRALHNLDLLGLGADASAANPLSAKLNAALFAAKSVAEGGSGDLRFILNKSAAANTVSQLYQDNYSGRAETGLTGDDRFHVKVSADGSTWKEAIDIDPATGVASFPSGIDRASLPIASATALGAIKVGTNLSIAADGTLSAAGGAGAGPAAWTAVSAWAASTVYTVGPPANVVTYSGGTHVCAISHTSSTTFDATKWTQVAAPGATGATGPQGATGAAGPQGPAGAIGATGPSAWTTVSAWAASTAYTVGPPASVVTYSGGTYVCAVSHTSTSTFDATKWTQVAAPGSNANAVTSVGLALPSIFTVSGSPVTAVGTLTGALATQSANQVFAGPASGVAATPTFRALASADLPVASATALGGVKAGANLSVAADGMLSLSGAVQNVASLAIGTGTDSNNLISAKLNSALFDGSGGTGSIRCTLNKAAAANTASFLFQDAFSGRAEFGLTGDDHFHVKVSVDGLTWLEAINIDPATGAPSFPNGGAGTNIVAFAASGTYTPSKGVKFVDVFLFGAGGGGGSGCLVAASTAASGGGGGGGGGTAHGRFTAAQIGASQTVAIGAGGAAGVAPTTASTNGGNGGAGGPSKLGALLQAVGGGGGAGGQIGTASGGGGGGGVTGASNGSGATAGAPGLGGGPGGSGAAGVQVTAPSGGGGGGGSGQAASGGGSGGGFTSANATNSGGAGGNAYFNGFATALGGAAGVAGGVKGGGAGTAAPAGGPLEQPGAGGGGGASDLTAAGPGGAGGAYGGGGGGGGAAQNGGTAGAGGAGGAGYAVVVEYF